MKSCDVLCKDTWHRLIRLLSGYAIHEQWLKWQFVL